VPNETKGGRSIQEQSSATHEKQKREEKRPKEAEGGAKGLTIKVAQTKEKLLSVSFSQRTFRASRFFIEGKLYDSKPLQVTINLRILEVKP
jgi:hypothetical protein